MVKTKALQKDICETISENVRVSSNWIHGNIKQLLGFSQCMVMVLWLYFGGGVDVFVCFLGVFIL